MLSNSALFDELHGNVNVGYTVVKEMFLRYDENHPVLLAEDKYFRVQIFCIDNERQRFDG